MLPLKKKDLMRQIPIIESSEIVSCIMYYILYFIESILEVKSKYNQSDYKLKPFNVG